MSEKDITTIRVAQQHIGIIGLSHALKSAAKHCLKKPDEDIKEEILHRLSKQNYIPENAKRAYGEAFLREFKKSVGQEFEDEPLEGIVVKVLGQGCSQCDRLEKDVMEIMAEESISGDLEHVRDSKEISKYGVFGVPALVINGSVKAVGKIPSKHQIKKWLEEASKLDENESR
jgi:small redox-active disulfide protein 2